MSKPSYTHEENTVLPEEVAANKVIIQSTLNSNDQPTPVVAGYRKKRTAVCASNTRPRKAENEKRLLQTKKRKEEEGKNNKKINKKEKKKKKQQQERNNKQTRNKQKNGELEPSRTNRLTSY